MADDESESFISKLSREKTLSLRVAGGRVLVNSATPTHHDRSVIELKCWWSPGWTSSSTISIGKLKQKSVNKNEAVTASDDDGVEDTGWSLHDFPIMISLYRTKDGWLADNANRPDDNPIIGRFSYHEPIQSSDGFVNEKRPTGYAWVALGEENFALARSGLLAGEAPGWQVGLDVLFPSETVKTGWTGSKIRWDGDGSLPVTGAKIVWKRGDWDSDDEPDESSSQTNATDKASVEHGEVMETLKKIDAAVTRLALPLWLASAAAIAIFVASR